MGKQGRRLILFFGRNLLTNGDVYRIENAASLLCLIFLICWKCKKIFWFDLDDTIMHSSNIYVVMEALENQNSLLVYSNIP